MKTRSALILALPLAVLCALSGCLSRPRPAEGGAPVAGVRESAPAADSRMENVAVPAPSLAGNRLGLPTEQPAQVFLPPFIKEGEVFPVLYFFHGFGDRASSFQGMGVRLLQSMDSGILPRFIIVSVNGDTNPGGSFWVNSPITGNWEDFVAEDLVPFIDSMYPTVKGPEGRGLLGFSMGGFAALNLALRHADLFGTAFAVSPGAFDESGLEDAMPTWDQNFRVCYGRAFAPGSGAEGGIPRMVDTPDDKAVQELWRRGFGGFDERITAYLAGDARLDALRIEWGTNDYYPWIPRGSAFVAKLMKDSGLPVETKTYARGHDFSDYILREQALPFFLRNWGM